MERPYRLISSDSHVTEAGDLWVKCAPVAKRGRAAHIELPQRGETWLIEGIEDPIRAGRGG